MSRRTSLARSFAGCLAAALVVAACGAQESSESDRDRNLSTTPLFVTAVDGVARNRIGDASMTIPFGLTAATQPDGSTFVATTSFTADGDGLGTQIAFARLVANRGFDDTFADAGVRTLTISRELVPLIGLSTDGHAYVGSLRIAPSGVDQISSLRRYDIAKGAFDASFGNGGEVEITSMFLSGRRNISATADGGVVIVGSESETRIEWNARHWTKDGVADTAFGDNGRLNLNPPTYADTGIDETFTCEEPTLADAGSGITVAAYGCGLYRQTYNENGDVLFARRAIATRSFDEAGQFVDDGATITFLDSADHPVPFGSAPTILDIDFGTNNDSYVTIDGPGRSQVLTFTNGFATYRQPDDPNAARGVELPSAIFGQGEAGQRDIGWVNYVRQPVEQFVGISIAPMSESTNLEAAKFPLDAERFSNTASSEHSLPISSLPMIFHDVDTLSYVGSDVFMNIVGSGVGGLGTNPFNRVRLGNLTGYVKIGRDGATVAPYGSPDGIAKAPDVRSQEGPDLFNILSLYPALDGSLYSFSYTLPGVPEPGSNADPKFTVVVTKRNAEGQRVDQFEIVLDDFVPFLVPGVRPSFDGTDHFYFTGFDGPNLGIAKVSLASRGIDRTYGTNGVARFPVDPQNPMAFDWIEARLQVAADGTIDAFSTGFSTTKDEFGRFPMELSTIRFTPKGVLDAANPLVKITLPGFPQCSCPDDARSLQVVDSAVVDAAGRLLLVLPNVSAFDEEGNEVYIGPTTFDGNSEGLFSQIRTTCRGLRACRGELDETTIKGGGKIRRYSRNGELDTTFGKDGVGGVSLYQTGVDVPLTQPHIAIDADGNIFTTVIGMELDVPKDARSELDIRIRGEYSYSVMVDANGTPINFTPQDRNPVANVVAGLVNEARTELPAATPPAALPAGGTTGGTTGAPSVAAIEAPAGSGTSAVMPADVVQVVPGKRPVITISGTPADRTIEVRWSIPESLAGGKADYTVTASPGGQKCTTSTTTCVFKKLEPWTAYSFTIKTVAASSGSVADSVPSLPVKPVRIIKRGTITEPTKLITPASAGKQTWKATGGCKVTKDGKTFTATKDAGLCTLSLTTAKAGKVRKTTRVITVVVRAVAK